MKTALHHLQYDHIPDYSDPIGLSRAREASFRYSSAVVLCIASICLMAVFFMLNFWEQKYNMLPALMLASALPIIALFRLGYNHKAPVLLFLCGLNFIALSTYMFIYDGFIGSSALLWFMFVPPLVVFSMPRRISLALFALFSIALALLLFSSHVQILDSQFSLSFRIRFMTFMISAFMFFWLVEYVRDLADRSFLKTFSRMQMFAYTDPLTGIGNRCDFQNHLKWLQARSERNGEPFSVAFLDLDHFKNINNAYGHRLGDATLRHVAKVINGALRESDRVFRWSGQVFAVIMPGTGLLDARLVVERVRRCVELDPVILCDGRAISATVSAGVDAWSRCSTLDKVMSNADLRLYLAKKLGRNRVYAGAINQAVGWFPRLVALPRMPKAPVYALAHFPAPMALPAHA